MLGQGSPISSTARYHRRHVKGISLLVSGCLLFVFAQDLWAQANPEHLASSPATPGDPQLQPIHMRLRISWGGGSPQKWFGSVRTSGATLSDVVGLGLSSDAPGSVLLRDGQIQVRSLSATNYGGFDVTVTGREDSQLSVEMYAAKESEATIQQTVSMVELASGMKSVELDAHGNRLTIARAPGDAIQVKLTRDHLIFEPGESFPISIVPHRTGLNTRAATCRLQVVAARGAGPVLWANSFEMELDANGSGLARQIGIPVPLAEGVYDLQIEFEPHWYEAAFQPKGRSIRRKVQFVVLSDQSRVPLATEPWTNICAINPAQMYQSGISQWTQFARMAGLNVTDALGNGKSRLVNVETQTLLQMDVGAWQAVPLAVDKIGCPHFIEIQYSSEQATALGFSVLQADSSGEVPSFGFDSGVVVPKSIVNSCAEVMAGHKIKVHRIVFWPTTKTPYLLVANRHDLQPALIGQIRVFAGPERLPAKTAARLPQQPGLKSRQFMAFYENLLFPENFCSDEFNDPQLRQPLDDWVTFYQSADRFVQYLRHNNYQGAFVTVVADGSAIFPSSTLAPTPSLDSGVFFSSGQDPIRKDVLRMLFQMFDREGLVLIPTLALNGTLPDVEAQRGADASPDFDLLDFRGTAYGDCNSNNLPRYNPLDVRVQNAVRNAVREIVQRYRGFSSFQGISVICRPDTYALLPGLRWGYDPTTVNRFLCQQSDIEPTVALPTGDFGALEELLLGQKLDQWTAWRANEMSLAYSKLFDCIENVLPGGKLYLAAVDLYRNDEISRALNPSLHASIDFEQAMLQLGMDPELTRRQAGIVLLKPNRDLACPHQVKTDAQVM